MRLVLTAVVLTTFALTLAACRDAETGKLAVGLPSTDAARIAGEPSDKVRSDDTDGIDLYRKSMKCPKATEFWIYKRWFSDDIAVGFDADRKVACIERLKVLETTTVH